MATGTKRATVIAATTAAGTMLLITFVMASLVRRSGDYSARALSQWALLYGVGLLMPAVWSIQLLRKVRRFQDTYPQLPESIVTELTTAAFRYIVIGCLCVVAALGMLAI